MLTKTQNEGIANDTASQDHPPARATLSNSPPALDGWLVVTVAASAGVLFGWSIVCVNTVLLPMRAAMHLTSGQQGWVVSALPAGALVGCLLGARILDRIDARSCLLVSAVLSAVGAAGSVVADDAWPMVAARLLLGIGVGLASAATPVFVAARSSAARRGVVMTTYQLAITIGILVAFFIGWLLDADAWWRTMLAFNAIPAVLLAAFALLCAPLRPTATPHAPAAESTPGRAPGHVRAVVIVFAAALMNALTGVGLLMYYSTDIFTAASRAVSADLATFSVGVVNTTFGVVAVVLVGRFKRLSLLSIGLAGMAASLVVVAAGLLTDGGGLFAVAACLVYMAFFAISAGPLAWLLVAEVAPARGQGAVTAGAAASNWGANMMLAFLFPIVAGSPPTLAHVAWICLLFAALTIAFLLYFRLAVPETKGLSMAEIQDAVAAGSRR